MAVKVSQLAITRERSTLAKSTSQIASPCGAYHVITLPARKSDRCSLQLDGQRIANQVP